MRRGCARSRSNVMVTRPESNSRTRAKVKDQGQRNRPRPQDYSLMTFELSQMDRWIQIKKNKKKIARIGMLTQFWKLLNVSHRQIMAHI